MSIVLLIRCFVREVNGSTFEIGSMSPTTATQPWMCPTWCPELRACIDSLLWCDGVYDCPSGLDESDLQCLSKWNFPKMYWYILAAGTTFLVLFIMVSSVLVCRGKRYENGDISTANSSFRPPPGLNDAVYPHLVGTVGSPSFYDKKLAVSWQSATMDCVELDLETTVWIHHPRRVQWYQ